MAHGIAAIASTTAVSASAGIATAVQNWASFGSCAATIIAAAIGYREARRRRRRRRPSTAPKPPPLGADEHRWEIYAAQLEQHLKDQKGDDG